MLRRYGRLLVAFHVLSDALLAVFAFGLSYVVRFSLGLIPITRGYPPFEQYVAVMPFVAILVPLAYQFQGVYRLRRGRSRVDDFFVLFIGTIVAVVLGIVSTLYFEAYHAAPELRTRGAYQVSRIVWAFFLVFNVVLTFGLRELIRWVLERRWKAGIGLKRILIAGAGELGRVVAEKILQHSELGYQVVGFVDDRAGGDHLGYRGLPLLGTLADAPDIVRQENIDHLYVALPLEEHVKMLDLIEATSREVVDVKVVPDLVQFLALRARLEDLDGVPIINIHDVPLQGLNAVIKRIIDIAISGVSALILLGPFAIIAATIKWTSPGRVFYRQERMGLDGRPFWVYKFRSMQEGAEDVTGPIWARDDDPRCTPVGRFLRRWDFDELPQIWNVLKGDMSIVGPRPERPFFVDHFCRSVQAPVPAVHAAPQGEGRDHRLGSGQRLAWQHLSGKADRIRPLLHRKLVGLARSQNHVDDALPRRPSETSVMKKRVVVTGAAGFIGSHLAEGLLNRDCTVIGIDNLLTGDLANIAHLAGRDFVFIKHDVTNYINVDGPVDAVLHWASPASPIDYLELPIPTLKVGALGTHKALGLAKAKGARFVIASTSEVYGDPLEHPQKETYWGNVNPIGPRGVYDEAKRFAEAMTMAYHRYHDVDTKIVRIFNTYGPRMRIKDGRAVPAFISQALLNEDVTVFGDGQQTRSFCYVDDLVAGILKLMDSDLNDPVNIGNPHEMTIEGIAKTIIRMTGSKSKIIYQDLPVDDPKVRQPDITNARTLLGWEPKVELEEGLVKTIEYFKRKMNV
jgi:dTDP-glucose 4,6-dehydratase